MSHFTEVKKIDAIPYEEFVEQYLKKRIPVVFKNAFSKFAAEELFTPDFFSKNFGSYKTHSGGVEYTMDEILAITKASTPENPAPYPILYEVPLQMPELLEFIAPDDIKYAKPNWFDSKMIPYGKFGKNVHLFIGGRGNQYTLHKDFFHTNAWITQLYGQKKIIVFPDGQETYLYAGKEGFSRYLSPINMLAVDDEKFPDYRKATPLEVILEPGETIFIPNGVWHNTEGMGHNISFIFDQVNELNFKPWKKDIFDIKVEESRFKANLNYAFANTVGRICAITNSIK